MSYQALLSALKGGTGSGNFGHSGRPGKIGGSSGGGLPGGLRVVNSPPKYGYFITPDDQLLDFSNYGNEDQAYHLGVIEDNYNDDNFAKLMKLSSSDRDELDEDPDSALYVALNRGSIRISNESDGSVSIQTRKVDKPTLRRLQKLHDDGKLPQFGVGYSNIWENADEDKSVTFSYADFLSANHVSNVGGDISLKTV